MLGLIPCGGIGQLCETSPMASVDELWRWRRENNQQLFKQREDVHSEWLLQQTVDDAEADKNSMPVPLSDDMIRTCLLHPRFCVEQSNPNGQDKLRAIDHFSWSGWSEGRKNSMNGATMAMEKLKHHTLDNVAAAMA
eukprot:6800342-Karenia_brevis.AAC.1